MSRYGDDDDDDDGGPDDEDDGPDDDDDKNGETLHLNSKHQPSCLVKQTIF